MAHNVQKLSIQEVQDKVNSRKHVSMSRPFTVSMIAFVLILSMHGLCRRVEAQESLWQVKVDFNRPIKAMHPAYNSININNPTNLLEQTEQNPAYDEAIRALNFRMMRFQGPGLNWDYKKTYTDEDFKPLSDAVTKAFEVWGVQELMFAVHRISLPKDDDGRFIKDEFSAYAKFLAQFVRRFPQVLYWEPFNELDHPKKVAQLQELGQGYGDVVELYVECAKAMKAVNPRIRVGGPSLCDANAGALDTFLKGAGGHIDFVSWHDYPTGSAKTSDEDILASITGKSRFVGGADRLYRVMERNNVARLPLYFDEYHINYAAGHPKDHRTATQFTAVFCASVLSNMSRTQAQRVFLHELRLRHYGLVGLLKEERFAAESNMFDKSGEDVIRARPAAWVYKWFNQYAGGEWVQCDSAISEADAQTPRGPLLDACAWRTHDAKVVLLVNKDTAPRMVSVQLGPIHSDGFALPVRTMMVADGVPTESYTAGTRNGRMSVHLPAMSVLFIVQEQ